ncbi:hypothetical protein DL93DRAFT_1384092 [Clavulina sp. PMI_390]|nr:hypothetical protein DL93DRAFT_1384092 [Clavulina sp. PMI_390]
MPQEHVMFSIPRRPAEFSFAVAMLLITWIIVHQVICPNNNGCQPTSTPAATTTTPETESFCLILPTIIITPPEIDVIPSPTDSLFSPMPEPASPIESDCSSSSSSIGTESPTLYASSVTSMSDDDSCDSEDDLPPTLGFSVSASRSFTNLQDLVASQDGEPSAHDEPELPRSGWYDDDEDNDIGPIPTFDTPSFLTDPPEPDPPTELNDDVPFIVFPSLEYVPIRQQIRQRVHAIMGVPSPIATEPESCLDAAEDSQPELASTPTSFIAPTSSRLKPLVHDPWFPTHEPATVTYVERTEIAYSDEFVSDEDEDDEEEELRIETEAMTRLNNVRSGDLLDGRKASKLRWGVEYTRSLEDGHKDEVLMILSAMETFAEECQEAKYEYGSFGVSDHDA